MKLSFLMSLVFALAPGLSFAGPIAAKAGAGEPVSVVNVNGSAHVLIVAEDEYHYYQETPDGGWGDLGVLALDGANSALLLSPFEAGSPVPIYWKNETLLYSGQVAGGTLSGIVSTDIFASGTLSAVRDSLGVVWVTVGTSGLHSFDGVAWTSHDGPTDFSPALILPTANGIYSLGPLGDELYGATYTPGEGWEDGIVFGMGSNPHYCQDLEGVHHVVYNVENGTEARSSSDGLESWSEPITSPISGTPYCLGSGFQMAVVSEGGEWNLLSSPSGDVEGVLGTGIVALGPYFPTEAGALVSASDQSGMARVGRIVLGEVGPPALGGTRPDPALAGESIALVGFRLNTESASVLFDGEGVFVAGEFSWIINFFLDENVVGQIHSSTVITNAGQDSMDFSVLAIPPIIDEVSPSPMPLGALIVVEGKHMEQVTELWVGDTQQIIDTTDLGAVVFHLDVDTDLGSANLELLSPTGSANFLVSVIQPPPKAVKVTPNPVYVGQFLEIEGLFLEEASLVTVGGVSETILSTTPTRLQVHLVATTPLGPQTILITGTGGSSAPFGPIQILPSAADTPLISELLPASVSPGMEIFVRGERLEELTGVEIGGQIAEFTSSGDNERRLRIPEGLGEGSTTVIFEASKAVVLKEIEILSADLPHPTLSEVAPSSVDWGEALVLRGEGLSGVWQVWVGNTAHGVETASTTEVSIVLAETTVGGPQSVVAIGAGVSNELEVFVAKGPPEIEEPDGQGTADAVVPIDWGLGGTDAVGSTAEEEQEVTSALSSSGGGCQSGGESGGSGLFLAFFIAGALVGTGRRAWC